MRGFRIDSAASSMLVGSMLKQAGVRGSRTDRRELLLCNCRLEWRLNNLRELAYAIWGVETDDP